MSYTSPLLFDVIDGQGAATLNVSQKVYLQAHKIMDSGHRLTIRARPKSRFELSVRREHEPLADHPITLTTSGNTGIELHDAAERLIAHAHSLLFDPLPW
jgi:hypothetical protein